MQAFVTECYVEPENIPTEIVQEEDIFLFLMLTGQLKTYDSQMCIYALINQLICITNNRCLIGITKLFAHFPIFAPLLL
jgi:hypothetical protein